MKRIGLVPLNAAYLLACAALLAAPAALYASDPTPVPTASTETAQPPSEESTPVQASNCIRDTGTHLQHRDENGCLSVPGRSYSKADMDSTGATTAGDALKSLSPSLTVTHH